jgi:hypothetical protein
LEFVAKKKKVKVTIEGSASEMVVPSIGQLEVFYDQINKAEPKDAIGIYIKFLVSLGLDEKSCKELDFDSMIELVKFVTAPKKKD